MEDFLEDFENHRYTLCRHCDHFVDEDTGLKGEVVFIHLDDGEQEYNHNPEPSGETHKLYEWRQLRPDLFIEHPDLCIGPNSKHHSRRGKRD